LIRQVSQGVFLERRRPTGEKEEGKITQKPPGVKKVLP